MNSVFLLLVVLALGGNESEGTIFFPDGFGFHCFKPCMLLYSPVCGSDGVSARTFPSSCLLLGYNCWHKKAFQQLKVGECDGTEDPVIQYDSRFCPHVWDPVCGTKRGDEKTFSNLCLLHSYNRGHLRSQYTIMLMGDCEKAMLRKQIGKECSSCTKIYDPVCGKEGQELVTFPNECVMHNYNCFESRNFSKIKNEECTERLVSTTE